MTTARKKWVSSTVPKNMAESTPVRITEAAVLKGYATAASVILTGVLSAIFFGTVLDTHFFLAVVTVTCSISLYQTPPPPPPGGEYGRLLTSREAEKEADGREDRLPR